MRSALVVTVPLSFVLASCARLPTPQEANDAVLMLREYGSWAWALGIALIWADLVLPIPQTAVIAALGIIYGTWFGGLLGSFGLIGGGLLGYGLMLTSARRLLQRFAGLQSLHKMERSFERRGAWAIVLTRSLPFSVPEAMVFLAGLAGMPLWKFTAALSIGSVPTAFAFAAIGAGWADQPIVALGVSYVLPILLLPIVLYPMRLRARSDMSTLVIVLRAVSLLAFAGPMLLRFIRPRREPRTRARHGGADRVPVAANLAAFALFLPSLVIFPRSSDSSLSLQLAWLGSLLAIAGAALVLRSRVALGPAWSLVAKADQETGLVTTGPYRLVRHPIYLGLILLAAGEALAFSSVPAFAIVLFWIIPTFAWRARSEEKLLSRIFGERYRTYQKRTKMIIPHLL